MDSIFKNDWNALSDDLFFPMFNSGRVFNFKRLFSREDPPQAVAPASQTPAPVAVKDNVWVKILDVKGWEPSEIELVVTADGKQLMVSGEKEEETKNDEGESYDLRRFKQTIDLPDGLDEEEISSALSKEGKLMITAPYLSPPQQEVKQQQQNIAVQQEEKKSAAAGGRQLLLRQDSKIEKSWNRIFDDFFSPVFESSGLHSNDEFWSDSSAALTKHRNHISQTMNNAIAKRFNFHQESRLENWDQVFDEFFFPMFQTNRFFHSNRGAAGGMFSSTAACENASSNATSAVSKKDGASFETEYNLLGYKPSDIKVQVTDGVLTVEAMQEQEEKAEGSSFYKMKQFRRAITVPQNVDVDKLTSSLGEDGKLLITAPLLALEAPQGRKEVQIAVGRS